MGKGRSSVEGFNGASSPSGARGFFYLSPFLSLFSHSFVMVKGAALLLQEEEKLESVQEGPATPLDHKPKSENAAAEQQEQHLQQMVGLMRPEDSIRLVRL
uniref:Uncharacterized protein n=1 Tax=Podarcis muralis TaxID=64176 RepID=A0A670IXA4_PODMU